MVGESTSPLIHENLLLQIVTPKSQPGSVLQQGSHQVFIETAPRINRQVSWRPLLYQNILCSGMEGTSWAEHLLRGRPLLCAVCRPRSQAHSSVVCWKSDRLGAAEDGLKYRAAQLLGFVKEIMQHPHFFMEKYFILLKKILFYKWGNDWKDLYQNMNSDFSGENNYKYS